MNQDEILLVYDKECPVCDRYCRSVQLREDAGGLKIVNARESSAVMNEITSLGLDIDEGMVLRKDGRIHYGADAIHELARIGDRKGFFNRINTRVFETKDRSRSLYPILRSLRNLLLKILGRTRINNLDQPDRRYF